MARWADYVFKRGDNAVADLWRAAGSDRSSLYIVGEGFDPRMMVGPKVAAESGAFSSLTVVSMALAAPGGSSPRAKRAQQNLDELKKVVAAQGWGHIMLPCPSVNERKFLGKELLSSLIECPAFDPEAHVVVDISALPTSVYFALIGGILKLREEGGFSGEFQVVVTENVEIDSLIDGEGAPDDPAPIVGYGFGVNLEPSPDRPLIVWSPVLGAGADAQLEALADRLEPDEICPVLPFPARNPRRDDDLLLGLREQLVDALEVEPSNYIYAHEANPFDLYRALGRLNERYGQAVKGFRDARVVVSIHSSKTLSLGGLLAGYEHRLPVINADPEHYEFDDRRAQEDVLAGSELSCVWLEGTPTA
jgi:hypothetical protein